MASNNVVFISYKSEDRELIKPYLNILSENGIEYWWDEQIDGKWGDEIASALSSSKIVLGFVTEKSMKSQPVWAEFRRAGEEDKLIPVRLDKAPYTYEFETILGFLNYFDLSTPGNFDENTNPELNRLVKRLKKRVSSDNTSAQYSEKKLVKTIGYEAWFEDPKKLALFPYLISLCIYEGTLHERIQYRSDLLQKEIVDYGFNPDIFGFRNIEKKSTKLAIVGAKIQTFQSEYLPYPIEYVEFLDRDFKDQFLDYVWREMDQFKGAIVNWFKGLINLSYDDEDLKRVALALSIIGRKHFNSVYTSIIVPWIKSNDQKIVDCADLALSLMNSDESIFKFVEKSVNELTFDLGSESSYKIALRLACGYTGISLPDVAIALMRRLEDLIVEKKKEIEDNERLINGINENIKRLASKANSDNYALVACKIFIENIKDWLTQPVQDRKSYLPAFIALSLFESTLILENKSPTLLLVKILTNDQGFDHISAKHTVEIFNNVLTETNIFYREKCLKILNAWCAWGVILKDEGEAYDYICFFLEQLHHISPTRNDKERIAFAANKLVKL